MPTPARPADYTLTPRDAVRLHSGGWRRFAAILGTSRDALSRPLAVGLTTLGLAGLLVATLPSFSMGSATSGPALEAPAAGAGVDTGDRTTLSASAAAEAAPSGAPALPAPVTITDTAGAPSAAAPAPGFPGFVAGASQEPDTESVTNGSSKSQGGAPGRARVDNPSDLLLAQEVGGVSPLVVLSLAFLIAGLGLFVLRWTARRFGD
jgi:hypothetical protein